MSNSELIKQMTSYKQVSVDSDLSGKTLEANLEPYLEYLKVEENKRKDRDYELYLELKEKFERKAGLP